MRVTLLFGWIPRIFRSFSVLFLTYSYQSTHQEVQINAEFFFSNILEYSCFLDFFKVFRTQLLCAVRRSHVLCIIRFLKKFHIVTDSDWGNMVSQILKYPKMTGQPQFAMSDNFAGNTQAYKSHLRVQHHSLNQNPYLNIKKPPQEKNKLLGIQPYYIRKWLFHYCKVHRPNATGYILGYKPNFELLLVKSVTF